MASNEKSRRDMLKQLAAGSAAVIAMPAMSSFNTLNEDLKLKGNINHSVCAWTYSSLSLEELCITVKKIGFSAIDLLAPKDWTTVQRHGITCSMCYTAGKISLTEGWNRKENHSWLIKDFEEDNDTATLNKKYSNRKNTFAN